MFGTFSDPFEPLLSLQRALDRARGQDYFGSATTGRGAYPAINLFRNGDSYILTAEMPGMRREDIHLEIKENQLRLHGERLPDYDVKETSLHRRERSFGRFDRTIRLPINVDADGISARYENGILNVTLIPAEEHRPRRITVG